MFPSPKSSYTATTFQHPGKDTESNYTAESLDMRAFETPVMLKKDNVQRISLGSLLEVDTKPKVKKEPKKYMKSIKLMLYLLVLVSILLIALVAVFFLGTGEDETSLGGDSINSPTIDGGSSDVTQSPTLSNTDPDATTSEPTTLEPTTLAPTTAAPTTSEPTTAQPTTAQPTTQEPTSEPTLGPTSQPFQSFPFVSETEFKDLCGKNMDPSSAVNGVFFAFCKGNSKLFLCNQDLNDLTNGLQDEEDCANCGCPINIPLFPSTTNPVEELCQGDVSSCENRLTSLDFVDVDGTNISVSLAADGFFRELKDLCVDNALEVCIHSKARLECREDINLDARICDKEDEICECSPLVFQLFEANLGLDGLCDITKVPNGVCPFP